jgi:hypothetical protein
MTFVALFRAINVSGRNKIPMADLRGLLAGLGLRNVRTYLQTGNAVFDADESPAQKLATAIEVRLERDLGPRVGVLVLPADAFAAVVTANPFLGVTGAAGTNAGPEGAVRRRAASRGAGRLPEAAARLRPHEARQRLLRAQARRGGDHAQLAHGPRARRDEWRRLMGGAT